MCFKVLLAVVDKWLYSKIRSRKVGISSPVGTENPLCKGVSTLNLSRLDVLPLGGSDTSEERRSARAQVSASSLDRSSKLRGPSSISLVFLHSVTLIPGGYN
ncbi:hypothetical protein TNCV_3619261 [Trichonephila clavipes]|nr:hypothetical protein TNCV_3619261 [Trichonephila clavipes]